MRPLSPWMALAIALVCASSFQATAQEADPGVGVLAAEIDDPWSALDDEISRGEEQRVVNRPAGRSSSRALAARSSSPDRSWTRTVGALAAVVGLIALLAWGYRAATLGGVRIGGKPRRPGLIEVLSRTSLSPRQSLCLVRVGPRVILVGQSHDNLSTLDVIDDAGVAAGLAGEAMRDRPDSNVAEFQRCLDREAGNYIDQTDVADERVTPESRRVESVRAGVLEAIDRIRRSTSRV